MIFSTPIRSIRGRNSLLAHAQRKGHAATADRVHGCADRRPGVPALWADGGGD